MAAEMDCYLVVSTGVVLYVVLKTCDIDAFVYNYE